MLGLLLGLPLGPFGPTTALAQPTVDEASEEEKNSAREHYHLGAEAYREERYQEALEAFGASGKFVVSPNTQLMHARCLRALDKPLEAYHSFGDVIALAERLDPAKYADTAATAREERSTLEGRLALIAAKVKGAGDGTKLMVGGIEIPHVLWGEPIAARPGEIRIEVSDPERGEDSATVELAAGMTAAITLELGEAKAPGQPAPAPVITQSDGGNGGGGLRIAAYVSAGVGLAGLAAFGILGSMSQSKFDDLEAQCSSRTDCSPELRDTADSGATQQTFANVGLGVGVVGVAAGVVLFLISGSDGDVEASAGLNSMQLKGRF
ncbi:MAG: hypothetical protein OEZ06_17805 [Myxococcales bacterium]|nr:hypothetical protein [Myxococcales bacterium]